MELPDGFITLTSEHIHRPKPIIYLYKIRGDRSFQNADDTTLSWYAVVADTSEADALRRVPADCLPNADIQLIGIATLTVKIGIILSEYTY